MKVRAKFHLSHVERTKVQYAPTQITGEQVTLVLHAVHDNDTPENERFTKLTPSGTIRMTVDNPEVVDSMPPGQSYYVDFTPTT
jgi:hypothetical protein